MKINFTIENKNYRADLSQPNSIAISLVPNGEQPSHFGAPACISETLEGGGFIGDTKRDGSCNVNVLTIVPHCNGTHTESVAHIVNQNFPVYHAVAQEIFATVVISVEPVLAADIDDAYLPGLDDNNQVITRAQLESTLEVYTDSQLTGLAIRTRPNDTGKCSRIYGDDNYPVYLTNDAMRYITERKIQHLMVDFPSVDKMYDEGQLSNHRIFWQVTFGEKDLNESSTTHKTITEMIYVEDTISDGLYLCNLQIPQIDTDAVPSRPVLYPLISQD